MLPISLTFKGAGNAATNQKYLQSTDGPQFVVSHATPANAREMSSFGGSQRTKNWTTQAINGKVQKPRKAESGSAGEQPDKEYLGRSVEVT